ncbi:hypothetical protein [Deinococcus sp. DB0503]|uniref:hypothetical protein n=1 Tax=Deinococcus sp. DB0503 TaxID=2479203 RepID=UPI0018DFC8D0|nr:hypothetical protein [Deinococcus sp. DB0503]MBI0446917.1 hypothetical protein [Deinococcus sp. DB0503]
MATTFPDLNQRLAAVVAGYLSVGSGRERLWGLPDGTYTAHCPNFAAGERWEDLERGLHQAGMLTAVQARLGQALGVLHSTVHWRDALLTMLDVLSADSRLAQAEGTALAALGFEPDLGVDTPDRRVVLGTLRRVRAVLSLTQRLAFFDRPTFCRDAAGQFWLVCQTYAARADAAPLLDILAAHGLEGRVLEVSPFAPAARLLMIRAVPVPAALR